MPILKSFFGCTDHASGGIILGWIAAILRGIFFGIIILLLGFTSSLGEFLKKADHNDLNLTKSEKDDLTDMFTTHLVLSLLILAIFTAVGLATAIVFIFGCQRKRSSLLIPYLVFDVLSLAVWFFNWIGSLSDIGSFLFSGVLFGIMVYLYIFAISVFQYFKDLERQPPQAVLMQPMVANPNVYEVPPPSYPNLYPTKETV